MTWTSISASSKTSIAIVDNLVSCEKDKENKSLRRKRNTLPQDCVLDEGKNYRTPGGSTPGKPDIIFLPWPGDQQQAQSWQECADLCVKYSEKPYSQQDQELCGYWSYYTTGKKTCHLKAKDFYEPRYSYMSKRLKENSPEVISGNKACGLGEFLCNLYILKSSCKHWCPY